MKIIQDIIKLFEYLPFINQAQVTNVENICDSPQSVTEWFFVIPEIIYNQIPQEFLRICKKLCQGDIV